MQFVEQLKLFTGADVGKLENEYNSWMRVMLKNRSEVPVLSNIPFRVIHRDMVIRNYEGDETFALAVYYEDVDVPESARGKDRAAGYEGGFSAVGQEGGRSRRGR